MAIVLVTKTAQAMGQNGGTTTSIDTTGATFLAAIITDDQGGTTVFSDSKANSWSSAISHTNTSGPRSTMLYAKNATAGSGHTFTTSGSNTFGAIVVYAFSGVDGTAPLDQTNANDNDGSSTQVIQAGSITPSVSGSVVIAGLAIAFPSQTGLVEIDSGMSTPDNVDYNGGVNDACDGSFLIQTSAGAINPQWTINFGAAMSAIIASFIPGSVVPADILMGQCSL